MVAKELRAKNIEELKKEIAEKKKELEKYVNEVYKGKEKNISKTKFLKRDIARINTIINEKKILKEIENA